MAMANDFGFSSSTGIYSVLVPWPRYVQEEDVQDKGRRG